MRPFDDPFELFPDQRFHELVSILAAGVLRLRKQQLLAGQSAETSPETSGESAADSLDVSPDTVLSVTNG